MPRPEYVLYFSKQSEPAKRVHDQLLDARMLGDRKVKPEDIFDMHQLPSWIKGVPTLVYVETGEVFEGTEAVDVVQHLVDRKIAARAERARIKAQPPPPVPPPQEDPFSGMFINPDDEGTDPFTPISDSVRGNKGEEMQEALKALIASRK